MKPQGPVIGYFILLLAKIIFCRWDDRGLRSQLCSCKFHFCQSANYILSSTSPLPLKPLPKINRKNCCPPSLPILSSPAVLPQPLYFHPLPKKRKDKERKKKRTLLPSCCLPAAFRLLFSPLPLPIFSKEKATKAPYSLALRGIGKKKEGKRAAVVRYPPMSSSLLSFLCFSSKGKAGNAVFMGIERVRRKEGGGRLYLPLS